MPYPVKIFLISSWWQPCFF